MKLKPTTKAVVVTKPDKELVFQVRPALDIADQLKVDILSDKKINFTREKAFSYLELETFQGERQVNEHHVQFLYNAYVGGRFMWDHVILALCQCDGKKYRINGQHTCWMRVNLNEDIFVKKGEVPQVREVMYGVQTEAQMRSLYSTFDQNKTRSPSHVFRALMSGTKQAEDLWPSVLNTLSSGMKHWLYENKDKWMITANDMAQLVADKYEVLFRIVGLFIQEHYASQLWLRRSGVVAALFATFEKGGGKSPEFWVPVINGLALTEKSDPRYVLREYLNTHGQSMKVASAKQVKTLTNAEDTYRICILAWSKWRKGQKQLMGFRSTEERIKVI